jgi:MFS transporter, putative metabolite:H+ symporter
LAFGAGQQSARAVYNNELFRIEGGIVAGIDAVQTELDSLPLNRRHGAVFALCSAGLFFESLNLQIMSFAAPKIAVEWQLGPALTGTLISSAIMGMLVGTYLFGALADRFGRRLTFQVTVGIFSALTALSGFTGNYMQLLIARFGAGVGIGGSIPVETAVLAEFMPTRWRGRTMALWAIALPVGGFVAPLCVAAMPSALGWRGLLFLGGIPALLILFVRRIVPETPPYLVAKGRAQAAEQALAWIAKRPVRLAHIPKIDLEPSPQTPRSAPERMLFVGDLRRATFTAWTINFGSFFAYYGMVLWMPALLGSYRGLSGERIIQFMLALALAGIAGRLAVIFGNDRIPRHLLITTCLLAAAVSLAVFSVQTRFEAMLIGACAAAFFLEGSFSAIIPFVAELYPASARATGVGWAGGMGRLGTALAPLTVGALVPINPTGAILTLAIGAIVAGAASLMTGRNRLLAPL